MGAFLIRRALQSVLVLFGVTLGAFLLIHLAKGDPARVMLGTHATDESVAALREQLGLDHSLPQQYFDFVTGALHFDFGNSTQLQAPVADVLPARFWTSVTLTLYASIISLLIAVPLGIYSAIRRNRPADHAIRLFTMVGFAMPPFWLGLLLILIFSVQLGWFPSGGEGEGFFGHLESLTLPALTLGIGIAPMILRTLRSSVIETLGMEFVEAARARGFSKRRILLRGVLRNSMIATVTVLALNVGILLGGVVVVENVFDIQGLGAALVDAVKARDYPMIQALALTFGVCVVVVNVFADFWYALIDPRVRL